MGRERIKKGGIACVVSGYHVVLAFKTLRALQGGACSASREARVLSAARGVSERRRAIPPKTSDMIRIMSEERFAAPQLFVCENTEYRIAKPKELFHAARQAMARCFHPGRSLTTPLDR